MAFVDYQFELQGRLSEYDKSCIALELPVRIRMLERHIQELLIDVLIRHLTKSSLGLRTVSNKSKFRRAQDLFSVEVVPRDPYDQSHLTVSILKDRPERLSQKPVVGKSSIVGSGKAAMVEIIMDKSLENQLDDLLSLTKGTVEFADRWLLELERGWIREFETTLSRELYREIRLLFPGNKEFYAKKIYLVKIEEQRGFFVWDSLQAENTLKTLSNDRATHNSPIELFAHLLQMNLNFDEMHSKFAVLENVAIDKDISNSTYFSSLPELSLAEETLYDRATLYPIVRTGGMFLIAAFPTNWKSDVLPVLDAARPNLQKLFHEKSETALRYFNFFKNRQGTLFTPESGGFIGSFVGQIMKSMNS